MNATREYAARLDRATLGRILRACGRPVTAGRTEHLRAEVAAWFALDLAGFLNRLARAELETVAAALEADPGGSIGELRARLWLLGAEREARGRAHLGTPLQPVPIVLGGKLIVLGDHPGAYPGCASFPRPIPAPRAAPSWDDEPESLEELLARADDLVGLRLGEAGRDKGAFGATIAGLLGVPERGFAEPDWRGEVEIKTVPVRRDRSGFWRLKEDPAVGMEGTEPLAKLVRVLWIARVADGEDSPILSWFYQELDARLEALARAYLHTRPKGGAGATTRGWYLHKSYFLESGFSRSLNDGQLTGR